MRLAGDPGKTVGAFRNQDNARSGKQACEHAIHSYVRVGEAVRAEGTEVFRRDSRSIEEQLVIEADKREFLKLPLVGNDWSVCDLSEVLLIAGEVTQLIREFGRAGSFGAFAQKQDSSARLRDMLGGGNALAALVERKVERIPSRTGDDHIGERR